MVDKLQAIRFRIELFALRAIQGPIFRFDRWRKWPSWARPGVAVCCCDLKHRVIDRIIDGDTAVMRGGGHFGVFQCLEGPVAPDLVSCHRPYEWMEDE